MNGHSWQTKDYLLAAIVDVLALANWQRSGGKGPRPKPVARPGVVTEGTEHFGADPISVNDFEDWWAR